MRSAAARSMRPASGSSSPASRRRSVVLPTPLRPSRPRRAPGVRVKLRSPKERAAAERLGDVLGRDQALGAAVGGGEIDLRHALHGTRFQVGQFADEAAGLVDAGARFAGARLGAAAEPLHFAPDHVGERFLAAGLRQQKRFLGFQEVAVAAFDAEDAFGIDTVDFGHIVDHVVQEVAVVAHHHAGEGGGREQLFQPQDAFQIEMVGGFVQEQQVGLRAPVRGRWRGGASSRRRAIR